MSSAFVDAVERANAAGVTVVVAAGNDWADACNYSPSNAPDAITVGSATMQDSVSAFSNQGPCVDVIAPGQYINSASSATDSSFEYGTGTSMAAPHVAGAVALYLERNPVALPAAVTLALIQGATIGKLGGIKVGTPNLMLRTP